ncbi:AraC family transcriptional regulator N-terminal domain-containing protein [Paenibacillus hunanensis]
MDTVVRLLQLLEQPQDILVLVPLMIRENEVSSKRQY